MLILDSEKKKKKKKKATNYNYKSSFEKTSIKVYSCAFLNILQNIQYSWEYSSLIKNFQILLQKTLGKTRSVLHLCSALVAWLIRLRRFIHNEAHIDSYVCQLLVCCY